MDPFSHAVFGRTLAALYSPRARRRGTTAAVVLGALAPDVDAVLMPSGWDRYLWFHEIGTHSLLGSLGIAALTALVVRLVSGVRSSLARRAGPASSCRAGPSGPAAEAESAEPAADAASTSASSSRRAGRGHHYPSLVAAAWAGGLSHLVLDVLSGAQVRVAWPLTERRISLPLVAMAEPVLIAIFLIGSIALFAARKRADRRQRLAAIVILAVTFLFLDLKAVRLTRALSSLRGRPEQILRRVVEARWASLTDWYVYERTSDALRQRLVRAGADPLLLISWPIGAETPLMTRSRSLSTVRNFLEVHDLAFAVQRRGPSGDTDVLWSDIRFCWARDGDTAAARPSASLRDAGRVLLYSPEQPGRQDPADTQVQTALTASAGATRLACALWFGGTFDESGRVVTQRVLVGGWNQTRAP